MHHPFAAAFEIDYTILRDITLTFSYIYIYIKYAGYPGDEKCAKIARFRRKYIYIYTKEKEKKKQFEPSLEKILEHVLNF